MRVYVSSPSPLFGAQILAYAEYKLFAALARYAGVCGATVILQDEGASGIRCSVTVDLDGAASIRARVKGLHATGAIDRAAERVVELIRRRFQPEISGASP